jgi:hypothetical protein
LHQKQKETIFARKLAVRMNLELSELSQPSISLLGIRVDEPMNTLTDLLVSAVCFYAFYHLKKGEYGGKTHLYFRLYFLLLGFATLFGGIIGHGFLYAFSFAWKLPGWIVSMLSVAFIERSAIEYARPLIDPRLGKFFLVLNIVELLTIMSITIYTLNFEWVEFHSGYGLLAIVLPFYGYTYFKTRDPGSRIILIAVMVACLAALVFMNHFSLDIWFNYIDLSHVLMAIAAFIFYKGATRLKVRNES